MSDTTQNRPTLRGAPSLRGASVGPFPLITLIVVIAIGVAAFLAATYLETFGDGGGEPHSIGHNVFSRSAIGHRAFAEVLRKLDIPVQVSRFRTLDKAGPSSLLLVLEPDPGDESKPLLKGLRSVPHVLLVLPKWDGLIDFRKPTWIQKMELVDAKEPQDVLREVVADATVSRADKTLEQQTQLGGKLKIEHPQTFQSDDVTPLVETPDGILLGAVSNRERSLWILADPDLLSNVGIDEADNGVVAVSIVDSLLPKGGTVVIDETAHGFEQRPNLMRTLLHPPFLPILIAGIVTMVVLAWAGITRFGAPLAEVEGLAAGKLTLVLSAAKLLRFGTSATSLLASYRRLVLADAINELHGPSGLDEFAQAAWLDRAAAHRGLELRLRPVLDQMSGEAEAGRIDATRALRYAHHLYRWKQEIVHGTIIASTGKRRAGGGEQRSGGPAGDR
jgi:hypothetical protein